MTYDSPQALRAALEARIRNESSDTGISPDRLRRRVIFQRIVARLQRAEPGCWVIKGGMALEVRLYDAARLTKDLDLGLRDDAGDAGDLRERLVDALSRDTDGDGFEFAVGRPGQMPEDGGGGMTWRVGIEVRLAGRQFGSIRVDVSPRSYELVQPTWCSSQTRSSSPASRRSKWRSSMCTDTRPRAPRDAEGLRRA